MSDTPESVDAGYSLERFAPLVGQRFRISDGRREVEATLAEATDLREVQGAGLRSRQFSLVWEGPPDAPLPQRIYAVSHPALGTMELFLVTIAPQGGRMRYEAVFT